jgi:hypothetical protein
LVAPNIPQVEGQSRKNVATRTASEFRLQLFEGKMQDSAIGDHFIRVKLMIQLVTESLEQVNLFGCQGGQTAFPGQIFGGGKITQRRKPELVLVRALWSNFRRSATAWQAFGVSRSPRLREGTRSSHRG